MSDLLRLLSTGVDIMQAQNAGIAVASRNTANVNTEGYTRESVDLRSMRTAGEVGGVSAGDPVRPELSILTRRERDNAGGEGLARSSASALGSLETQMTLSGNDVVQAIAKLFAGFADIAAAPMDTSIRAAVLNDAQELTNTFANLASQIADARADANSRIVNLADQVSTHAAEIAALNQEIVISNDAVLMDKRELAAQKIADLVGGSSLIDPDGMMRVIVPNGAVLVDGGRAATLTATASATPPGYHQLTVVDGEHSTNVTTSIGGAIGGEIRVRDTIAAAAATELDQLAQDFATEVNAVHAGNVGMVDAVGRNFFNTPSGAADIAVNTVIAADPRHFAAAAAGTGDADNQGALALLDLEDQELASGSTRTFINEAIEITARVGYEAARANADFSFHETRSDALAALRDHYAGVSVEEELVRLSQFQAASQAASRFVGTMDQLLGRMLLML